MLYKMTQHQSMQEADRAAKVGAPLGSQGPQCTHSLMSRPGCPQLLPEMPEQGGAPDYPGPSMHKLWAYPTLKTLTGL